MSKIKNPQQKKRLSYIKDCRNTYGENDKASRKSIHRHKKINSKSERSVNKVLNQLQVNVIDLDLASELENKIKRVSSLHRRKGFRKLSDKPLGAHVERIKCNREGRYGRKKNS